MNKTVNFRLMKLPLMDDVTDLSPISNTDNSAFYSYGHQNISSSMRLVHVNATVFRLGRVWKIQKSISTDGPAMGFSEMMFN